MEQKILDFVTKEKIACFSVLLTDKSPHSATLHFSHANDPFTLYFSTENTSRKCQALLTGETSKASVVIGFSEQEWITFQMDGEAKLVTESELPNVQKIHYAKHPGSEKFKDDPATVFIAFTPSWYRYTDYNTEPVTYITNS
jgi:general stress protein 26